MSGQATPGSVITVSGEIPASSVGVTLPHEHILVDLTPTFVPMALPELAGLLHSPVGPQLRPLLEQWPISTTLDNVRLDDVEVALDELEMFRSAGGCTVVDCTVTGMGRDAVALRKIAACSSLNIIVGAGYYVERSHPPGLKDSSVETIAEHLITEVNVGIDGTSIRAGIIGEIGTSGIREGGTVKTEHITPAEEKVLRAAAWASRETGLAVWVHLDPRGEGAFPVASILASEGVPSDRIVMCHMDARPDLSYHRRVAELGVFVEYDHFGREYFAGHMGQPYTLDDRRIELLVELIDYGYIDQLLVSQDVCMKMDLRRHGGNGYVHILSAIVPRLKSRGISTSELDQLLIHNPERALAITRATSRAHAVTG